MESAQSGTGKAVSEEEDQWPRAQQIQKSH